MLFVASCSTAPKRGAFYQDDGPPERVPVDLARVPDAVARVEPFHAFANRPYTALGRSFTPLTDDRPLRQRGLASWYGKQFHGNRTAIGERYDMFAMSAAHPTMPLPSYARVTHTRSGASVIVRVNDRGPFKSDRVIDLSYAAAVRLGIAASGTGEVEIVRLTHADIRAGAGGTSSAAAAAAGSTPLAARAALPPLPIVPPAPAVAALADPVSGGPWSVQLGAFATSANAEALRDRIALLLAAPEAAALPASQRTPRVERDSGVFRVLIGAFADRQTAALLATRLERLLERDTALFMR